MLDQQVCYGVLTTFNTTWFFYAQGETLFASDGYRCDREVSPTLLEILYFFYHYAQQDRESIITIPSKRRKGGDQFPPSNETSESSPSSENHDDDPDYEDSKAEHESKKRKVKETGPSSFSSKQQASLSTYPTHSLNVKSYLGGGRYAHVFEGMLDSDSIAIKLYDTSKYGMVYLDHELSIYERLSEYQGSLIPKVLALADSQGNMVGYCMEFLQPIVIWDNETKEKAKQVVEELFKKVGLKQQDISPYNFGKSSRNEVLMFDMEEVSFETTFTKKEEKHYLKTAYRIIDGFR
jgi:hypothetical protein